MLIIVPWNYPINLTLVPLVGAIAAGEETFTFPQPYTLESSGLPRNPEREDGKGDWHPAPRWPCPPLMILHLRVGVDTHPAWLPSPTFPVLTAGNCVVLKPSEISKATEKILAEVLPRYLDQVSRNSRVLYLASGALLHQLHHLLSPPAPLLGSSLCSLSPDIPPIAGPSIILSLGLVFSHSLPQEVLRKDCLCLGEEAKWVGSRQGGLRSWV